MAAIGLIYSCPDVGKWAENGRWQADGLDCRDVWVLCALKKGPANDSEPPLFLMASLARVHRDRTARNGQDGLVTCGTVSFAPV